MELNNYTDLKIETVEMIFTKNVLLSELFDIVKKFFEKPESTLCLGIVHKTLLYDITLEKTKESQYAKIKISELIYEKKCNFGINEVSNADDFIVFFNEFLKNN